ncbi:uncharacterized mitochondrial protein AtMg00310-like [Rutidosis leptorrhynchoides]|uniref:uncharacterized mitochondrial protein AtMg00310-like n=1 Tax=Rutidosis leptorrhynchoides TaxID=125765 RepID=UPI003A99B985
MSFGERLTLVTSVLNSLSLYYFSLFCAPPSVLKKLECVRRNFFWGEAGDKSKISWVKWDDVIRHWADGGLNLGSLNCKNFSLIGKWWWRFLTKPTSLWVNVIKGIHGVLELINSGGGSRFDGFGVNFSKSFSRVIGNGSSKIFWEDVWVKDKALKDIFKRLVLLRSNLNASVADRVIWMALPSSQIGHRFVRFKADRMVN